MTQHFTDENFEAEVIEASKTKPVLVDFFAEWCAPCKMQAPIIEEVAAAIGDKAVVGKADTDHTQSYAMKYGVRSIPTLILFKDGAPAQIMVGMQSKEALMGLLEG